MYILGMILFVLSWWASGAEAACSGSGTTWSCTAGTTTAQVQTALNRATDGATLTFDAGSYTWNGWAQFSNSKGATLICVSERSCIASVTGTIFGLNGTLSGTNTHFYRISGFVFQNGTAGSYTIWFYGPGTMKQIRIDHNTFQNYVSGAVAVLFGENSTIGQFYGVMDHNFVTAPNNMMLLYMIGSRNPSPPASQRGSINNMFAEDNTITFTNMSNPGAGCVDAWGGNAIVWRHNTTTNCLVTSHGVNHGGGPSNWELYENQLNVDVGSVAQGFQDCYRCFHHQGSGELLAFNNRFTAYSGKNTNALEVVHYRDAPVGTAGVTDQCDGNRSGPPYFDGNRAPIAMYRGYPCWRQPGRDFAGNLQPMYVWNNSWSDTLAQITLKSSGFGVAPDYWANHMQANRDWYNAVSASAQSSATTPFNGTTGMGFGTLANRPTTCTTNALESGGGVGYFATDQGTQGILYRCSATNTWTTHYTPYTYPHPLQAGGGGGNTTSPSAPMNLRAQ